MVRCISELSPGGRLRRVRKWLGLTQAELGARWSRTRHWIHGMEIGAHALNRDVALWLASEEPRMLEERNRLRESGLIQQEGGAVAQK